MKTYEKIRLMREMNQWSQEDVADKLNLSTNGYAKIERGETRLNLPRLEQIAEIFHIDLLDLLQVLYAKLMKATITVIFLSMQHLHKS